MLSVTAAGALSACVGTLEAPALPGPSGPGDVPGRSDQAALCAKAVGVARAPLRRLTRAEYTRAVRDVFRVQTEVAAAFAPDEKVGGLFSSNLEATVSTIQLRQFMDAAEKITANLDAVSLVPCGAPESEEQCAQRWLGTVGKRAFRRPLAASELADLMESYRALRAADDQQTSLRVLAQALLQSPQFLYHLELDDTQGAPNSVVRLGPFALASRLSFMLWGSVPDDALLAAAEEGRLQDAQGIGAELQRMLADPRARDAIGEFHAEWLGLDRIDEAVRDPDVFPEWTPALGQALKAEAVRFADYILREERGSLSDLLRSSLSFPDQLALSVRGAGEAQPQVGGSYLMDGRRRAGLLTQPAFLAAHSHANQTSPILRGRALRERLFCQPLADPPPGVAVNPPTLDPSLTTRERYAAHRTSSGSCYACHKLIDDLGFALEHYDALGRFRERENGLAVDAAFNLLETDVDGSMYGGLELSARAAQSADVRGCYARQWLRFALGRGERYDTKDACAIQEMSEALEGDAAIADMLRALATSDSFTARLIEP